MTPLTFLLSRTFDGALAPEHRADLTKSQLRDETIEAHFVRSVPPGLIGQLLGFECPGMRSAMLLPYRAPTGGFMEFVRCKIFPALVDGGGHAIKYLQPRGTPPRLYFTRTALNHLDDPAVPLVLCEGEKKALALSQHRVTAVGFAGIEAWHARGNVNLLPDFDALRLDRRLVELVPDGDAATNPMVARGVERFAWALRRRGARVKLVVLPTLTPAR